MAVGLTPTGVAAQTVGSASLATHRSCATTAPTALCDGSGAGQQIVTRAYGGGSGVGGTTSLDVGGGNLAWSTVSFDGMLDLPQIRAYTSAPGNVRMNINSFAFQSYTFHGTSGTPFSISSLLHIVDSSSNPTDSALPNGAIATQYVGIWDSSILGTSTTAQDLFNTLFYAGCGTSGVLGANSVNSISLGGGSATYSASTSACSPGSLNLIDGQQVLVVAGLQLPVNRGGFADSSATFTTMLDPALSQTTTDALTTGLTSAIDSGVSLVVRDTIVSSVPEPATWGMFIIGFGVVGASFRRKRRAVLA